MNLFTGLTNQQILSVGLTFLLFNVFIVLEAAALGAFYVASRPRPGGTVRTAALWHVVAGFWFLLAVVSTVWAAPAEKAFTDNGQLFTGDRFAKVVIGLVFAAIGLVCMLSGAVQARRQKRAAQRQAMQGVG